MAIIYTWQSYKGDIAEKIPPVQEKVEDSIKEAPNSQNFHILPVKISFIGGLIGKFMKFSGGLISHMLPTASKEECK